MEYPFNLEITPSANMVTTDSVSGVPSTIHDVQSFLEYLVNNVALSASPGFTWGRSGNTPMSTYLLNDSVPSNVVGRIVPINSGVIAEVFVASENADTWTLSIQRRSGASFTEIGSVSIVASRTLVQSVSIAVNRNDELALQVSAGACKNPVVGLIIKGSI